MATPELTLIQLQPSAPPTPDGSTTSIPIPIPIPIVDDGNGTPSLHSTKTEQQEAMVIQDLEQQLHARIIGSVYHASEDIGLNETCSGLFKCLSVCFKCAWSCVQLWTPLSATFIIYWLIYRPDRFHPRIDSAVLAAFDITDINSSLHYDLALDLSFHNSHRFAIHYLDVAASVFYNGTRLGPTDDALPSFIQGRKNRTVLHPTFLGVVTAKPGVAAELQRERMVGTVHLRVTVSLTLMYKVLFVKDVFFYKYDCWLWFSPSPSNIPALFSGDGGTMCWRV